MCEHKNIVQIEQLGDYDGILYSSCRDCGLSWNRFTGIEFDQIKKKEEYGLTYQYKNGKLVGLSQYKASGLDFKDDLTTTENQMWGTRGEDGKSELVFIPVKDITVPHILNIINDRISLRKDISQYFDKKIKGVIDYPLDTKNE